MTYSVLFDMIYMYIGTFTCTHTYMYMYMYMYITTLYVSRYRRLHIHVQMYEHCTPISIYILHVHVPWPNVWISSSRNTCTAALAPVTK